MKIITRRAFLRSSAGVLGGWALSQNSILPDAKTPLAIQTVTGAIQPAQMGLTLIHEHILVDFIGAAQYRADRWSRSAVVTKMLPYLRELKALSCQTLVECTPAYLGRDPLLLKMLAVGSGLQILTNTGYYGAVQNKFLPAHAFTETANQLAARWIREFRKGIEDTGIKPGFIKISVEPGNLSELHRKLMTAAARTHLKTGLVIASHTGFATPAFEQIELLKQEGVHPRAFIWVHAQNEPNKDKYIEAAAEGAWVSLDGLEEKNAEEYLKLLQFMKDRKMWHRTLLSHDAGWYKPNEPESNDFRSYTVVFKKLIPMMKENDFSAEEINQLLIRNPAEAFEIRIRPREVKSATK